MNQRITCKFFKYIITKQKSISEVSNDQIIQKRLATSRVEQLTQGKEMKKFNKPCPTSEQQLSLKQNYNQIPEEDSDRAGHKNV